jgi:transcriptional regulator with XRE-family HTH domain
MRQRQPHYIAPWRKFRGLNATRLAERLGMSKSWVSRLESGEGKYTQETLEAIADALQCEPADLLRPPPVDPILAEAAKLLDRIPEARREEAVMFLKVLTRAA